MVHERFRYFLADIGDCKSAKQTVRLILLGALDHGKELVRILFLADHPLLY